MQPAKGPKMPLFVPGDLDLWPWASNSSEQETKHVFPVNLAQIRSAFPGDISHIKQKLQRAPKTKPYAVHCMQ